MRDWEPFQDAPGDSLGHTRLEVILSGGAFIKVGDHVRIRPKRRADALDLMLEGREATVESIEQDYENRIYLALILDDDPGSDFGFDHKIAHRFFFQPNEVELVLKR